MISFRKDLKKEEILFQMLFKYQQNSVPKRK